MAIVKGSSFEYSEKNIQRLLVSYNRFLERYQVMMPNCYCQSDNECDVFMVRKSMLSDEFEIKISRDDFVKDGKKIIQYREIDKEGDLFRGNEWEQWCSGGRIAGEEPWKMNKFEAYQQGYGVPNYFWYVLAEGIIKDESEIPDYAGLIIVSKRGGIRIVRNPKMLHKRKVDDKLYKKTLMKGYSRYIDDFRGWK